MQKFEEAAYRDFAEALRERVAVYAPEWTGGNDSDPGVTLVELFAFLTETLLYRTNLIPERGHASAIRLAQSALMLAGPATAVTPGTLERLRYFAGRLLSPDDLTLEQDYFRTRLRRLNRELYGPGIVGGLDVSVERAGAAQQVVVAPGFAIDARGEEIEVPDSVTAKLPQSGSLLYVILTHCERPTHPQSTVGGAQFGRIEESFEVRIEAMATGNGVALARLRFTKGRWHVDPAFRPPRRA